MFKKFRQNFAQIKLIFIRQEKENDIYTKNSRQNLGVLKKQKIFQPELPLL